MNQISLKLQGREFYLHAAGSEDMNGLGLPFENKHYKWLDYILLIFNYDVDWLVNDFCCDHSLYSTITSFAKPIALNRIANLEVLSAL